jgi:hypothetical protein
MKEPVIPCDKNQGLEEKLEAFKIALRTKSHTLIETDMSSEEFYNSGLLRSAIESLRGSNSAAMSEKREFVSEVLNDLLTKKRIRNWSSSGSKNRFDYSIELLNGKTSVIELKGCLDGNNTNIYERPLNADEFIFWSVCQNPASDPRKNIWSGLHTRLSADLISREIKIDGLIVWDMLCGKFRKCPKLVDPTRAIEVGKFSLPPPCLYVFPASIPSPRKNPKPRSGDINDIGFLGVLAETYKVKSNEVYTVGIEVAYQGNELARVTEVTQNSRSIKRSKPTAIKRK